MQDETNIRLIEDVDIQNKHVHKQRYVQMNGQYGNKPGMVL